MQKYKWNLLYPYTYNNKWDYKNWKSPYYIRHIIQATWKSYKKEWCLQCICILYILQVKIYLQRHTAIMLRLFLQSLLIIFSPVLCKFYEWPQGQADLSLCLCTHCVAFLVTHCTVTHPASIAMFFWSFMAWFRFSSAEGQAEQEISSNNVADALHSNLRRLSAMSVHALEVVSMDGRDVVDWQRLNSCIACSSRKSRVLNASPCTSERRNATSPVSHSAWPG